MDKYIVYKHTFPNNKVYIGITSQHNPYVRWGKTGGGYRNHYPVWYAIQKYGWDNIQHEIVYSELSEDEAKKLEVELIALYDATNHKFGYNVSPGGDSVSELTKLKLSKMRKGHVTSEETKRKIGKANSKALKGRKVSEQAKEKNRLAHIDKKYKSMSEEGRKNIGNAKRGIKLSDEHKQKIGEANKGKIISEKQRKLASIRMTGTHLSDETKQKLSESLKLSGKERAKKRLETLHSKYPNGWTQSVESNKKRSEALKGRVKSEETKQKMRKPKSPEAIENMKRAQRNRREAEKLGLTYNEYLTRMGGSGR